MGLIVLTFVACLAGTDRCHTVEIGAQGTIQQCTLQAQLAIIDWLRQHPGYEPRGKHVCESGRRA